MKVGGQGLGSMNQTETLGEDGEWLNRAHNWKNGRWILRHDTKKKEKKIIKDWIE